MKEDENTIKQEWEKPSIISLDAKQTGIGDDPELEEDFDGELS